jgi:hypothetical protein
MGSRRRIPLVFLAVLTALTAVFAVLALTEAPTTANLDVQNGTNETFRYSQQFLLDRTTTASQNQTAAALSSTQLVSFTAPDHLTVYKTQPKIQILKSFRGQTTAVVLRAYAAVTTGSTPWVQRGGHFTRTESLPTFFHRVSEQSSLPGKVIETAIVRGGYLVYVHLLEITSGTGPGNGVYTETYAVLRVNGTTASKLK